MKIARLRAEAERLRRLARGINNAAVVADLEQRAREIEEMIAALIATNPEGPAVAC